MGKGTAIATVATKGLARLRGRRSRRRPVAVITDATSAGHYLPRLCAYYADLFGDGNVIVQTYPGVTIPGHLGVRAEPIAEAFDDGSRAKRIGARVATLLDDYETVVRVDADEFLVVDPALGGTLADHIAGMEGTHLTSRGFDVIPAPGDGPLDAGPVLGQRRLAFAATSLNKTGVVRRPTRWNDGFHYCDASPRLGGVILLHLKRADIDAHRGWNEHMLEGFASNERLKGYYAPGEASVGDYTRSRWALPTVDGPDAMERTAFDEAFFSQIAVGKDGIHDGPYTFEQVNVAIPKRFFGIF